MSGSKIGAALFAALVATAAGASTATYRVDAFSEQTLSLNLCGQVVDIAASGDGDTDLDFWIYGPGGRLVHVDDDGTDYTFKRIYRQGASGCSRYRFQVANLGDVHNNLTVTLRDR